MSSDLHPRNMCTTWYHNTCDFIPFMEQNTTKFAEYRCDTVIQFRTRLICICFTPNVSQDSSLNREARLSAETRVQSPSTARIFNYLGLLLGPIQAPGLNDGGKRGRAAEAQYLHLHLVSKISTQNCYISVHLFNFSSFFFYVS
jgi:hypothetical protein